MKYRVSVGLVTFLLLTGCQDVDDSVNGPESEASDSTVRNDPVIHSLLGSPVTQTQFVTASKIDNLSSNRQAAAFEAFEERYRLAKYLLENEITKEKRAQIRIATVVSKEVLDEYFDGFLDATISEASLKSYYEQHKNELAERRLHVTSLTLAKASGPMDTSGPPALSNEQLDMLAANPQREAVEKVQKKELDERTTRTDVWRRLLQLQVQEWSDPMISQRTITYYRIDKIEVVPRQFDAVKEELRYQLQQEEQAKEYQRLLEELGAG